MQLRIYSLLIFVLTIVSCASKKNSPFIQTVDRKTDVRFVEETSKGYVVSEYHQGSFENNPADLLSIKGKMSYKVDQNQQNLGLSFRIKKDSIIWMTGDFLGLTVIKAIVTPERVAFYNKIEKKYFDGDYELLKNMLGVDVSFKMLQSLIVGDALFPVNEDYKYTVEDNAHVFYHTRHDPTTLLKNSIHFFDGTYRPKKEIIEHLLGEVSLEISYPIYKEFSHFYLPYSTIISVNNHDDISELILLYNKIEQVENLSFKFQVPEGYSKIRLIKKDLLDEF